MHFDPLYVGRPAGEIKTVDGQPMRHLGDGQFVPASESMEKRFMVPDNEALHMLVAA